MEEWIKYNNEVNRLDENGRPQYHMDRMATRSYFVNHINKKMQFFEDFKDRIEFMIENNYYDEKVIQMYDFDFIEKLDRYLKSKKFRFMSFMATQKFYEQYAMKTDDGKNYLERYEDRVLMNALTLGWGNEKVAKRIARQLIKQTIQPATPTFLNCGRKRAGRFISCFLLRATDSTEGINYINESASQLSRFGGGVAIDLSLLRGSDEPIKGIEGASTSVVLTAKILEATANKFNQLGQRSGAFAVYIDAFHIDSTELMNAKKINADTSVQLKTLSIGLVVKDKLYELAEKDKDWYAFYPHSVFKKYGIHLADMDMNKYYDILLSDKDVRKRNMGKARDFFEEIARTHIESGYPYIMNFDVANNAHALKDIGLISMSNLCVEILQIQSISEIHHRGDSHKNKYGYDISCNLISLNIANVMDNSYEIEEIVSTAVDSATSVSDTSTIPEVPSVESGNEKFNAIGIGAMNLHGYLAKNHIMYDSFEAIDFANTYFSTVKYYAFKRSMEIAKERGETFYRFEDSEYAKGNQFDLYINKDHSPKTEKVKGLFVDMAVPTQEDWRKLNEDIMTYGIYNAYLLAIAPTGSISYLQNASPSILPITSRIETRETGDSKTFYPMPFLSEDTFWYYKDAYKTDMRKMIDLVSVIQRHVDQSISTTLFVDVEKMKTGDLASLFIYARKRGLKTIYYSRTTKLSGEDCESCAV